MLGLSKEVINKSRFCDWKTIIFFNYIYDTNRLPLWSVFWYLMYSFMNLIYTRKVNLYQLSLNCDHYKTLFSYYVFYTCTCNIKYMYMYFTNAPDVEICLFMRRYFSLLLCFYYIYLWKEVPLVYFIRMFQRGSSHGIHPGSNSLNWYLNQQNTYKAFT